MDIKVSWGKKLSYNIKHETKDVNDIDRGALIGMILGDGCITSPKTSDVNGQPYKSARFVCTHSIKQLPYAQHKCDRMAQILGGKSTMMFTEARLKGRAVPYRQCRFEKTDKYLYQLREWIYTDGKKVITQRILDWLTDEGLAYWFADDGWSKWWKNNAGFLSSVQSGLAICRPVHECDMVLHWLEKKYGITGRIAQVNKQNMLSFRTQECRKLHEICRPHTPKSMWYKLDPSYVPHEHQAPGSINSLG